MYGVEPLFNLTSEQASRVVGGQACEWSEGVNKHDFEAYALTKAAAVAERLWSPATTTDVTSAKARLAEHVCRLNMRNVPAEAIEPNFCLSDL
jgi:hexosaminidase